MRSRSQTFYYYRRNYSRSAGYKAARRHISEREEFERQMGGSVADVKQYFFELERRELDRIFADYRIQYGASAESYARKTFAKWQAGSTQMSGLVAKRLFDLLPPRMPISKKLELAGNLWRHFGTSSSQYFTLGPNADPESFMNVLHAKIEETIQAYDIPNAVKARFEWLSSGDVTVKEMLLNHFIGMEKQIASDNLRMQLPLLQRQMREHAEHTGSLRTTIEIGKHCIDIWIDKRLDTEFREGIPERKSADPGISEKALFLIFVAFVAALILLSHIR